MYVVNHREVCISCLEFGQIAYLKKMNSDPKKDQHVLYQNVSDHDDDNDRTIYKFSPPLNVRLPSIINTPRMWTDWVCQSNCIHKFHELLGHLGDFNLLEVEGDRKIIAECLTTNVILHHGYDVACGNVCLCYED